MDVPLVSIFLHFMVYISALQKDVSGLGFHWVWNYNNEADAGTCLAGKYWGRRKIHQVQEFLVLSSTFAKGWHEI